MTDDSTADTAAPTPEGTDSTADSAFGPIEGTFSATVPVAKAEGGEETPVAVGYSPDLNALATANGDPAVFGHEMYELIGHLTGQWIDETSIAGWFRVLAEQAEQKATKEVVFRIANTPVPPEMTGDPALLLLDFRSELVTTLRRSAGIS